MVALLLWNVYAQQGPYLAYFSPFLGNLEIMNGKFKPLRLFCIQNLLNRQCSEQFITKINVTRASRTTGAKGSIFIARNSDLHIISIIKQESDSK